MKTIKNFEGVTYYLSTGIAEFCGINKKFLLKLDINTIRIAIDII